jgi:hypothetical protein
MHQQERSFPELSLPSFVILFNLSTLVRNDAAKVQRWLGIQIGNHTDCWLEVLCIPLDANAAKIVVLGCLDSGVGRLILVGFEELLPLLQVCIGKRAEEQQPVEDSFAHKFNLRFSQH